MLFSIPGPGYLGLGWLYSRVASGKFDYSARGKDQRVKLQLVCLVFLAETSGGLHIHIEKEHFKFR